MNIRKSVSLAPLTTFQIGGLARYFVEAEDADDIRNAFVFAREHSLPVFILGAGSNVLIADEGFFGLVIRMVGTRIRYEEDANDVRVIADAGVSWDSLVKESVERGLWGMENLSGIPSSVGASVVQNIGAYGVEVSSLVEWVEIYDTHTDTVRRLSHLECAFGYRESIWKKEGAKLSVVLRVAYHLSRSGVPEKQYKDLVVYDREVRAIGTLRDMRAAVLAVRDGKFPKREVAGTAGSFFMNPIVSNEQATQLRMQFPEMPMFQNDATSMKLSAGWIIDHILHMKGVRVGAVGTWPTQALIVVNYGGASCRDVMSFTHDIIEQCTREIGVRLTPEVIMVSS